MNLTLKEVAKLCDGELSLNSAPDLIIESVIINSKEKKDNCLFIALQGENSDGHKFVIEVLRNNTNCAAIVKKDYKEILPNLVYVDDPITALGKLASGYRDRFDIPIVAITGSNGKTTVKEMLRSICEEEFGKEYILATEGNLNNHLGVPLTLLKLNNEHKIAIIEMGMNHSGELNYLTQIVKPTIATVNNVMLAHAGFFSDITDIARAKGEIYHGLQDGGIACINVADKQHQVWNNDIPPNAKRYNFGMQGSECYLKSSQANGEVCIFTRKGDINTKLQVLGYHNQINAITATTLAINLGCSLLNIAKGLANYPGYKGRLQKKLAFNGALIIDDSYNANLDSVKAAINAIMVLPRPYWFIFADMKELGELGEELHIELGNFLNQKNIDKLLTIGELARYTNDAFSGDKLHFKNNHEIIDFVLNNLPKDSILLIKGSQSMNLAEIVDKLVMNK